MSSSWNIDTAQVSAVLTETAGHIGEEGGGEGLLGHMDQIQDQITSSEEAAHSMPVSIALAEFSEHYFGIMGEMVSKTASGVEGASDATTAYVNGDLEMATEAQAGAGDISDPPPPGPDDPH